MRSDPDSRLCQELSGSSIARGWKNVHQEENPLNGAPSAIHPPNPGEQNPSGSPEFIAVSPAVRLTDNKTIKQ